MFGPPRACPVCNGFEFRPSQQTGVIGFVARLVCYRPFRCYSCGSRVWRLSRSGQPFGKRWKSSGMVKPVVIAEKAADPTAASQPVESNPG